MYLSDFLLTWDKTDDELEAIFAVADILRGLRRNNISARVFDSGLAVSLFRDNSTRTRFSFASRLQPPGPDGSRTWTRASPRSPTARRCARPRT